MKMNIAHYKYPTALALLVLLQACGSSASAPSVQSPMAPVAEPAAPVSKAPPAAASSNTAPAVSTDLLASEMKAYESAKGVFAEHCAMCHTPKEGRAKQKESVEHFSMASYPFEGHHQAKLAMSIRTVLGAMGSKATMPADDPGAVKGEQLQRVIAWADAFDKAADAGLGYHANVLAMGQDDDDDGDADTDEGSGHQHGSRAAKHEHKGNKHEHKGKHEHKHEHKGKHED